VKKVIDFPDDDLLWLKEYKKTHSVSAEDFIRKATQEKIFQTKQELKLIENGTLPRRPANQP
jgi:hypothetical protein